MTRVIAPVAARAAERKGEEAQRFPPAIRRIMHRRRLRPFDEILGGVRSSGKEQEGSGPGEVSRISDRASVLLVAEVRAAGAPAKRVVVRNISATGLMVEMETRLRQGDWVSVNLGNLGWTDGTVAWKVGNRFGVMFDEQIDPANVREPIANAPRWSEPARLRRIV